MNSTPPNAPRHRSNRSLTSRTSLLTAAAIAGVLLAGTAAVAANIGILNAADSSAMGDLAATDELLADPATDAADTTPVTAETTPATTSTVPASASAGAAAQQYDISGTGTVWVMTTTSGLALDHVVAEPGWSAALSQGDLRSLQVDFTNGDRTIVFTASLGADGALVVDVTEPTTVLAETPAPTQSAGTPSVATGQYDDDHDDDRYESEDHDDHDDHDEYEGADDDD